MHTADVSLDESFGELKQATFLTTRTSAGSKFDFISQSPFLIQSFDVIYAVRVVKNVACLCSLLEDDLQPVIVNAMLIELKLGDVATGTSQTSFRKLRYFFLLLIFHQPGLNGNS